MYKMEDVDFLLEELDIVEVIGEYVELKKSGSNYKGLCPFHQDNNPSFVVNPVKNIYKCFVCGAGGNAIKFYSEYNKLSFYNTIEELATKYGISIKKSTNTKTDVNKEYYDIMGEAYKFFQDELLKKKTRYALEYLSKRKITPKLAENMGLGFAPNNWASLYEHLLNLNFDKNKILELGLAKENEKGVYDFFRNRIIFPIYSISGKVIAFGGRTLEIGDSIPKYINSQETPIFNKGKNLYGFIEKGSNIKKKNYSMLMEGYMDVLSAHAYGFDVALAPLGTSLTEDQAKLLKKYTSNIFLSFDMDEAGQKATERAIFILKNEGFNIRILQYENSKDPDDYLKKYGKESFLNVVKNSLEAFDYLFEKYSKRYNLDDLLSKQNFINEFKEFFICVKNDLEKSLYIDKLNKAIEIDIEILKQILIVENKRKESTSKNYENFGKKQNKINKMNDLEKLTVAIVLSKINFYNDFKDKKMTSELGKKIFSYIESLQKNNMINENIVKNLLAFGELDKYAEDELINISVLSMDEYSDENKLEDTVQTIYSDWFREELQEAMKKRENINKFSEFKKIKEKLQEQTELSELKKLYEKFKTI